ncbi:MAG: PEGA domain-containing protein [Candidatus Acidiferrales bacterium]|jgi:hypothetical protein
MIRYWKLSLMILIALAIFVPAASARPFVIVGGGFYGPGFWGPGYGWYGPGWGPYYGYAIAPHPNAGKVKVDTKMKDASVYVDGGYAGTVGDLKTFQLRAGTHDIELRDHSGRSFYQERVDVVAGKTIKLVP